MIEAMAITEDRADRFTFQPGQLTQVTDPQELDRIHAETGVQPPSAEEHAWVAEQWRLRYDTDPNLSTFALSDEYRRLKAQGKL